MSYSIIYVDIDKSVEVKCLLFRRLPLFNGCHSCVSIPDRKHIAAKKTIAFCVGSQAKTYERTPLCQKARIIEIISVIKRVEMLHIKVFQLYLMKWNIIRCPDFRGTGPQRLRSGEATSPDCNYGPGHYSQIVVLIEQW